MERPPGGGFMPGGRFGALCGSVKMETKPRFPELLQVRAAEVVHEADRSRVLFLHFVFVGQALDEYRFVGKIVAPLTAYQELAREVVGVRSRNFLSPTAAEVAGKRTRQQTGVTRGVVIPLVTNREVGLGTEGVLGVARDAPPLLNRRRIAAETEALRDRATVS